MWLHLYSMLLLVWPVPDPQVERGFEPPPARWAAGHRGVDLTAPPGEKIRAVAAGEVSFAGTVAGKGVVSISLSGSGNPALRVSYEPVRARVRVGERVATGQVVGTLMAQPAHCRPPAKPCLHLGLRRGQTYLDPLSLLRPTQPVLLPLDQRRSRLKPPGQRAESRAGRSPTAPAEGAPSGEKHTDSHDWDAAGNMSGQTAGTVAGLTAACALAASAGWARRRLHRVRQVSRPDLERRAAPWPQPHP